LFEKKSGKTALGSISSTFYARLFVRNSFTQLFLVTFWKKALWYEKRVRKMLMKLTPALFNKVAD
jgi:hypothetical protein